jgi:non-reducing end alpha-L-arabinofuranosidase
MKSRINAAVMLAIAVTLAGAALTTAQPAEAPRNVPPRRPKGPCDIYEAAADPCVAAHSTARALYASYNGPLYQVKRQSDGKTLDIGVVQPVVLPFPDPGGYADAGAQDAFCVNTYCWITRIYDQSPNHNDLTQAPRGGFSGPAMGGFNNLPIVGMAPIMVMGHKVYGVFIEPGMGSAMTTRRAPQLTISRRVNIGWSTASTSIPVAASTTATPRSIAGTTALAPWRPLISATPPGGITGILPAHGL